MLEDSHVDVNDLVIGGQGETEPPFELGQLSVVASMIDVAKKRAELSSVVLRRGTVRARREKDRQVQLVRLAKPKTPAAPPAPRPSTTPPVAPQQPQWSVQLGRFALEDWSVSWADDSLEYPVKLKLDQLKLELTQLTWPVKGPIETSLGLRWQESGRLQVAGPVTLEPLKAELAVSLDAMNLSALDGYAWEGGFNGTLEQATLGAKLKARIENGGKDVSVAGDVSLGDLSLLDNDEKPLLKIKTLAVTGLDYRTAPAPTALVDKVQLSGLRLKIERDAKGVVNLAKLTREPPRGGPAPPPPEVRAETPGPSLTAAVKAVVFDDLNVDWLDKQTTPPFSSSTSRLTGRLTELTIPVRKSIGVRAAGRVDQAPTSVTGSVFPNAEAFKADLKFSIEGYDLPHAGPYSVHYVAQPINAGKLLITLDAKVGQKKLDATTHLVVDQLEFGEKVPEPGPDAKSLPLGLAVAVLSDREGRIDLTLPVTGDMADPEFKWGRLIWQVVLNLTEKVALAPFSLMSGLLGGGNPEVLKFVAFTPGASVATGDEAKKLDTLATLLSDRPKLRLELTPGADPVTDRDALARVALTRSLLGKSRAGLATDGGAPALGPAEYERLISAAWLTRVGSADAGVGKTFEEKEAELLARQTVTPEDLAAIGRDRAAWCQSALAERGVPVTRVFVVEPEEGKGAHAQVDVGLR